MAKKSNKNAIRIAVGVVLVLIVGGVSAVEMMSKRREAAETAAAWQITGNACPTPAAGAAPTSLPRQMVYQEVMIAREVGGGANCNTIQENGNGAELKICQFIGPGALRVTTAKGTYDFAPRRGENASIVVRDDTPTCLLHINQALFN